MKVLATRKVDELGRIILPAEIRSNYEIKTGEEIDICVDENGRVVLRKSMKRCVFCQGTEKLTEIMRKPVCASCIETIKKI